MCTTGIAVCCLLLFLCVGIFEAHAQDADTALVHAVRWEHADCVRLLLDAGADTNAKNEVHDRSLRRNGVCLHMSWAIIILIHFYRALSHCLLVCTVRVLARTLTPRVGMRHGDLRTQNGWTALMNAAEFGRTDCARLLIDAGADTEAKDEVRVWSAASAAGRGCCFLLC